MLEGMDGTELQARTVVNAAGLHAVTLAAHIEGLASCHVPSAYFAKGKLLHPQLVVRRSRTPFTPCRKRLALGVHFTLDLAARRNLDPMCSGWIRRKTWWWIRAVAKASMPKCANTGLPRDGALFPGYAGMRPKTSGPHVAAADFVIGGEPITGCRAW